jgi:hypothetical protein
MRLVNIRILVPQHLISCAPCACHLSTHRRRSLKLSESPCWPQTGHHPLGETACRGWCHPLWLHCGCIWRAIMAGILWLLGYFTSMRWIAVGLLHLSKDLWPKTPFLLSPLRANVVKTCFAASYFPLATQSSIPVLTRYLVPSFLPGMHLP